MNIYKIWQRIIMIMNFYSKEKLHLRSSNSQIEKVSTFSKKFKIY